MQLVKRRAERAGLDPSLCTHSFRATGITACVEAGGALQTVAALRSEVERIRFEWGIAG